MGGGTHWYWQSWQRRLWHHCWRVHWRPVDMRWQRFTNQRIQRHVVLRNVTHVRNTWRVFTCAPAEAREAAPHGSACGRVAVLIQWLLGLWPS